MSAIGTRQVADTPLAGQRATVVARELADGFVTFLETGVSPDGLWSHDVFCDFTMPQWRVQALGIPGAEALRLGGHPGPSRVLRSRFDPIPTGFVLEVEEQWDDAGETWYCRELFRADVTGDRISALSIYCTGDWDRVRVSLHASSVQLIRP